MQRNRTWKQIENCLMQVLRRNWREMHQSAKQQKWRENPQVSRHCLDGCKHPWSAECTGSICWLSNSCSKFHRLRNWLVFETRKLKFGKA